MAETSQELRAVRSVQNSVERALKQDVDYRKLRPMVKRYFDKWAAKQEAKSGPPTEDRFGPTFKFLIAVRDHIGQRRAYPGFALVPASLYRDLREEIGHTDEWSKNPTPEIALIKIYSGNSTAIVFGW